MDWKYKGKEYKSLRQFPEGAVGFIYLLTLSDGKKYIGRKSLYSTRKRKFGKKELEKVKDKRLKTYEYITKESNWKSYASSSKMIEEGIKLGTLSIESKEIIKICFTDKQLTYFETQALFCYGVLEYPDEYYNDNILSKFYRRDLKVLDENNTTENQ